MEAPRGQGGRTDIRVWGTRQKEGQDQEPYPTRKLYMRTVQCHSQHTRKVEFLALFHFNEI